jgi:autotransporter-associated beta strand protein
MFLLVTPEEIIEPVQTTTASLPMKSSSTPWLTARPTTLLNVLSILIALLAAPAAFAASGTWTNAVNNVWQNNANWSGASFPGTAAGEFATFNNPGNGFTTIDLGAGLNVRGLIFTGSNSVASYTIGSGGVGAQTMTNSLTANADIVSMVAGVVSNQVINANLQNINSGSFQIAWVRQNSSASVQLAGNITKGDVGDDRIGFVGTGAGEIKVTGNISDGPSGKIALLTDGSFTGQVSLSGSNSYTSGSDFRAGKVRLEANPGNTTAGVTTVLPNYNFIFSNLGSGTSNLTLQLRADSAVAVSDVVSFNDGATAVAVNTANQRLSGNFNFDVNNITSGSGLTLKLAANALWQIGSGTTGSSTTFNVTGGNDYALQIGDLNVGNNYTVIFNPSTANMIIGNINNSSAGGVTKNGAGKLTITGAISSTGTAAVNAGTLALTNAATLSSVNIAVGTGGNLDVSGLASETLTLNSGQTLSGNGTVKGTIDGGAGTIAPGTGAGTLTVSNVTLNGGGILNFQIANVTTVGGGTNDYLIVPGTLTLGGLTTLNVSLLNGSPASSGKYTLISYGTYSGPAGDISSLFSIPAGFIITNNPTTKAIELVPTHTPINVLWVGGSGLAWDFTTPNWSSPDNLFYSGDSPRFDDTATTPGTISVSLPVGCGTITVSNSVAYGFSGSSISAGSLVKQSSGTLTIENDVTVSGGTLINGGVLQIGNGGTTGTLTASSLTNNGALVVNRSDFSLAIPYPITGTGTFTQAGTGSTDLAASNSYTGITTVSAGRINVGNSSSLGATNGGTVVSDAGAIYIIANVDVANESLELNGSGLNSDGSGALRKGGAGFSTWSGGITLGSDSTIGVDSGATLALSNGINGSAFALTKTGDGVLTLTANNTISNGFTLAAGIVNIGAAEALGQAPGMVTVNGGAIDNTSGTPLTLTQNQDLGNGVVTMDANRTLTLNNNTLTVGGTINGAGRLTVEGAGTLLLTGSNAFTGGLLLDDGTQNLAIARLANNDAAGTGVIGFNGGGNNTAGRLELIGGITVTNALSLSGRGVDATAIENISGNNVLSGTLSVFAGGTQYLIQSDAGLLTFSGATGDGIAMTVLAGSRIFTLRGAGDGVVSGIITNGVGTAGVTKSGTGTWTLSAANPYTGPTTVNSGTLLVNGSLNAGSAVTVNGGTLGGTGTIGGTVAVNSGGTLAPGTSVGTLTINGALTLNSGSTNTFEVNGTAPANDLVVLGSTVAYGGVLNIVPSGSFTNGQTFTLFSGAGAISGFNFNSIQGSPGSGKVFAFTNGVLSVVSGGGAPSPTLLTNSVTGGGTTLSLSWPAGQGWRLQQQITNLSVGLNTNWVFVTDSSVSSTNIAIDKANGTVFYRLVYP